MNTDNATSPVVIGGFMPLKTSTTRAFAAAIAFVAAGATCAGAAVLQLPVLGFGRAPNSRAAEPVTPVVAHKVEPRKIVRTRVVTDIVHRPAQPSVASAGARARTTYVLPRPTAPVAVAANVPSVTEPSTLQAPSAGTFHDGEDAYEPSDEGLPSVGSSTAPSTNPDQ